MKHNFILQVLTFSGLIFGNALFSQSSRKIPYNYTPEKPIWKNQHSFMMPDTVPDKNRIYATLGIAGGGYTIAYGILAAAWYKNEIHAPFHFFNDNYEWKGIDKFGHALGGYQGSRLMIQLLKWGGMSKTKCAIYGGLTGFVTLVPLEILDGFALKWGASPGDIIADCSGGVLAFGNEMLWEEQRIQMKISYHPTNYAVTRPDLFGDKWSKFLKDYNGHTIWFSGRVHSFLPESKFKQFYPKWLNLAFGYGANGMLGGYEQGLTQAIRDREFSQYYLALDLDLSQIKSKSPLLSFLLGTFGFIHLPAPTLEYNSKFGLLWHWLYL